MCLKSCKKEVIVLEKRNQTSLSVKLNNSGEKCFLNCITVNQKKFVSGYKVKDRFPL